jgi:hypothetical protein
MNVDSLPAGDGPQRLLAESRRLAQRVRAVQRATWVPLLVLAAVTFAAIPVYRYGHYSLTCRTYGGGRVCLVSNTAALVYWPIALVLAYVVIAGFYLHRARARGVGTRVLPVAGIGILIAAVTGGAAAWLATHPPVGGFLALRFASGQAGWVFGVVSPAFAIGLGLLALAVVEHSRALALLSVGYLVFAMVPGNDLGWVIRHPSPWAQVPRLVFGGSVLLVAGLLFAWAQRPVRRDRP